MKLTELKHLGPGIVVAATGIGAGDMIAAAFAGAKYGTVIIWAAIMGAILKYFLNEGIARWQLATGTTVPEGWRNKFHPALSWYFLVYLFLWSFIVAGALIAACGLAAHALVPSLPVELWGVIHSLAALLLVYVGRYKLLEIVMKGFIALMFLVVCVSAALSQPDWGSILSPGLPKGSVPFILGVIGGVGGSVTLLSYGYWVREKKWSGKEFARKTKIDLIAAYILTGLFGVAIMIIAAGVKPEVFNGSKMVIGLADRLGMVVGPVGRGIFLVGFWGAVFSSLLGVWQGVPYLFADSVKAVKKMKPAPLQETVGSGSPHYRFFLFYLAIPPMLLLLVGKPVWIVLIYTITGAFFMPFLAVMLLIMNNAVKWVKEFKNNTAVNIMLMAALVLFLLLCVKEISQRVF
ncbi:MAG: divalent metal cation transporter [bacterium]|nr:divalent metal cation transporter [bacterium]